MGVISLAMNKYDGNSGRVVRIAEPHDIEPLRSHQPQEYSAPSPLSKHNARPPRQPSGGLGGIENLFKDGFGGVLSKITNMISLDTEDAIIMLILWLMYRESHDEELLFIMGIMLLS